MLGQLLVQQAGLARGLTGQQTEGSRHQQCAGYEDTQGEEAVEADMFSVKAGRG